MRKVLLGLLAIASLALTGCAKQKCKIFCRHELGSSTTVCPSCDGHWAQLESFLNEHDIVSCTCESIDCAHAYSSNLDHIHYHYVVIYK